MWNTKLTDEEVKARTDITIKMANAAQESATIVSDQLTAIWNNFYDGSQSLEYYADVLTKLGAATASSTDEIAQGLEKFAAISDTIGLSYEYATAALTTITSNTRQSADVVGTALKTIFARIQDLEQGNTLDDGTTLGTYAQALQKVGIQVLDTNGNLIKMDDILDQMGEKWDTLSEAQQVALAQQVAGIRQYNQLVSLMDNWNVDDADSMKTNLQYIEESSGELQKQADVYAESWAAAQDRVAASAEKVYSSLIDEDFFIGLLDTGSRLLDLISNLIDGLGGVQGVLSTISFYALTIMKSKIVDELSKIQFNQNRTEIARQTKKEATKELSRISQTSTSYETQATAKTYLDISSIQDKMIDKVEILSDAQKSVLNTLIEQRKIIGERVAAKGREADEEKKRLADAKIALEVEQRRQSIQAQSAQQQINDIQALTGKGNILNRKGVAFTDDEINSVDALLKNTGNSGLTKSQKQILSTGANTQDLKALGQYQATLRNINQLLDETKKKLQKALVPTDANKELSITEKKIEKIYKIKNLLAKGNDSSALASSIGNLLGGDFSKISSDKINNVNDLRNHLASLTDETRDADKVYQDLQGILFQLAQTEGIAFDSKWNTNVGALAMSAQDSAFEMQNLERAAARMGMTVEQYLDKIVPKQKSWQEQLVNTAQILTSMISIYNTFNGILDTAYDNEKSFGEKFESIFSALAMQVGPLIFMFSMLKDTFPAIALGATTAGKTIIASLGSVGVAVKSLGAMLVSNLPYALIAVGVLGAIKLVINWINKAKQAKIDEAKETQEKATEEINKNKELAKSYQELYESYKETNEVSEDLQTVSRKLAEKLAKEGENVQALANNYKELNKRIDEYNAQQNIEQLYADKNSKWAYEDEFVNAFIGAKSITTLGKFSGTTADSAQVQAFKNSDLYQYNNATLKNGLVQVLHNDVSSDELIDIYEAGEQAADKMLQAIIASGEEESEVYKNLVVWLEEAREEYEALVELNEQIESEEFQVALDETGVGSKTAKSYQEFEKIYNELKQAAIANGVAEDSVDAVTLAYFKQNGALSDWAAKMQTVINLQDKASQKGNETYNVLAEMLKNGQFSGKVLNEVDWDALAESEAGQRYVEDSEAAKALGVTGNETNQGNINFSDRGQIIWTQENLDKYKDQLASLGYSPDNLLGSSSTVMGMYDDGGAIPFAFTPLLKTDEGLVPLSQNQVNEYLDYLRKAATEDELMSLDQQGLILSDGTKVSNLVAGAATTSEEADNLSQAMHYMGDYGALALDTVDIIAEAEEQIREAARKLVETGEGEVNASNLLTNIQSGKTTSENITEDEDYTSLMLQMDTLREAYPELEVSARLLEKTWLVGTQAYSEALQNVQDKLAEIKMANLQKDVSEAVSNVRDYTERKVLKDGKFEYKLSIEADPEAFYDTMDDLTDASYAVDVEIHTQAEQAFDSLMTAMDDVEALAGKIGDNFIIDASDIRELNNAFPNIIEGMEDVGNGSIKLKEQVVKDRIAEAQTAIKEDTEATVKRLENQAGELEARANTYDQMAAAARALAENETLTEEEKSDQIGIINAGLSELIANNNEDVTQQELDNEQSIADASKANSETVAKNWKEAYRNAAIASARFTKAALENMKTIEAGEGLETYGDFAFNYTGTYGTSQEAVQLEKLQEEVDKAGIENSQQAWEAIAERFEQLAASTRLQANDIRSMIAQIGGRTVELTHSLGKVGKSAKDTADELKKVAERYHEITREIQRQEYELDQLSKAKDRAFGKDRLAIIDQEIEGYKNLKEQQEKLLDLAIGYLAVDQEAVQKQFGGKAIFNTNTHEIDNWTELYDSATTQEQLDALEQYEETLDKMREQLETVQEIVYNIQDANYEKLQYKLELKLDIDDAKLKELEFDLKLYGDNFYKRVESAIAMMDKMPSYEDKLGNYWGNVGELDAKFAANKISQADYIDGLKEARDGIYEQLEALVDLDNEMMHYYEDTLSAATEELGDYTDHMEHLTSVFDHYLSLMDILGKQKDYDSMGDFLTGKADTLRDRLGVAKEYYQVLEDQRVKAEQALASASNDEERELLKENLDAIIDEVDAAEEEVLSLTEEWASAMKEVIENEMASIADTLEKALTNGLGFEELMDNFDKLNTRQEEYLTKTNQIYETNKLMRTASKALDETDNKVAKQKLKNFIEETQSLQENTKLSEYELEIQQAKYDLLLAEIALEEAQNAKSTVRLSRDNEGNFGYVYTADQDAVDDAEQGLDDAKNRLYNLSLEGQQDYTDKYLQAQQEMYNALTELQQQYLDGDIATEEEYERRKEEILYHYYNPNDGILTTYSNLYNVAVRTDADATADYWAKDYGNMTQNTADWYEAVNEYLIRIEEQTNTWKEVSETANDDVQGALEDSRQATEDLTDESEELKKMILKEVMPAIEDEINDVREQTEAYADQRQELMNLISTYRQYISTINSKISSASSSSSGGVDYSYKMAQAFRAGDSELYENSKSSRADKLASGDFSSVDNNRLQGVFEAASGTGSKADKANELIDKVLSGDEKFTKDTLDKYGLKTGGYTGAWGPEGKLAFLHEKELVLNQDDTENLLTAVSFIRDLVSVIDSQASLASLFNLSSAGVASSNSTLEQSVTIHAEFPNATNHSEIEEAFENLVNKASQYANRK